MNEKEFSDYVNWLANDNLNFSNPTELHAVIGIASEAGELLDIIKKELVYHVEPDGEHLQEELGDILHYMMYILRNRGWALNDLMINNVTKLNKRYPNGYSNKAAIERKDKND